MDKRLKDPIYGYIHIPIEYVTDIIDTASFQRLRRIIQTSYAPLYASAIHNRFVHSIGVFHLGRIVAEQLVQEIVKKKILSEKKAKCYAEVYQMACLLHDIGHAPFSHTGEGFYKTDEYMSTELHKALAELVKEEAFQKDIPKEESQAAKAHEIMSCIIGIEQFGSLIEGKHLDFFARCITGYQYRNHNRENDIKNCFIALLNSKVIDVDRLDYLIRDAYITGFETINIDYNRLLHALTIVQQEETYNIAYYKDALSIIENVVYAHDAEKKWIQNHPVVLYESYLIQHIILELNRSLNVSEKKLFSAKALSKESVRLEKEIKVKLLSDDDIIYLFKNVFPDDIGMEYFERRNRRHPVWKSEAEYNAYFNKISTGGSIKKQFMECMQFFAGGSQKELRVPVIINKDLKEKLKEELKASKEAIKASKDKTTIRSFMEQQKGTKNKLNVCKYLIRFAKKHKLEEKDFIIISADMFSSTFSKDEITKIPIVFHSNEEEIVKPLSEVCKTLKAEAAGAEFYYLYYRRKDGKGIVSIEELCLGLFFEATKEFFKKRK